MKSMKTLLKKLPLFCVAVLTAAVLSSCSGGDGPGTPRSSNTATPQNSTRVILISTPFEGVIPAFSLAGSGTATIDWGDGSSPQSVELKELTLDNYGQIDEKHYIAHTYAEGSGKKTIKVTGTITGIDSGNTAAVTAIDVTAMPTLKYLDLYDEKLTALDVSQNTALTWLRCPFNAITSLNLSANTALTRLTCQNNALVRLDVSKNTALTELYCGNNAIVSLDVSRNTALEELNCSDNALVQLNARGLMFLKLLACHENRLTSIDIGGCTSLEVLGCNWNKLSADELRVIFDALPDRKTKTPTGRVLCSAVDQTEALVPLYQNPGWKSLTDNDKKVATDKNWEIE